MSRPKLDFYEDDDVGEDSHPGQVHGWILSAGGNGETLVTSDELFHDQAEAEANFGRVIHAGVELGHGPNLHLNELLDLLGASGVDAVFVEKEGDVDAHWEVSWPDADPRGSSEVAETPAEAETVAALKEEIARIQADRDKWKRKARNR